MSNPPISRKSSFAAPARLNVPPSLQPSASLSSLHILSHAAGPPNAGESLPLPTRDAFLDSSASSVVNLDMTEGILVQETDSTVDSLEVEEVAVAGTFDQPMNTSKSKQMLRETLRKSLTTKAFHQEPHDLAKQKDKATDISELAFNAASRYSPREYFVLTNAGKPVFVSRPGCDDDNTASVIGVMQALISVFIDEGDKIRSINAGRTRITFLMRAPLYYVCVSSWGEPESTTRAHLEYIHLQILSIVTGSQLKKIFERRTNFDLRRLLSGAESFVISMLSRVEEDLAMTTSSLYCLKLDPSLRKKFAEALMPTSKIKDILYIILIAKDRVLTLIRPRKHSIHPADLHIILNTISSPSISNNPAPTSWIPFCLPKFNPTGFINAFISFIRNEEPPNPSRSVSPTSNGPNDPDQLSDGGKSGRKFPSSTLNDNNVVLVCVSGGADFEAVRGWSEAAIKVKKLEAEGTLESLVHSFRTGQTDYTVADLGIPGLRHFVYKSRAQVQTTHPVFEDPYDKTTDRRRLITLYQLIHDAIHAKSGQEAPLKLQYIRTESECVMGWITQPFELYIAVSSMLPKSAVVGAANAVTRWVKKEESKLFLRDAPVF